MNTKNKAILAYVVIFLVGGASGFFLNEALWPRFPDVRYETGPGGPPGPGWNGPQDTQGHGRGQNRMKDRMQRRMQSHLSRQLNLTEDQVEPFFEKFEEHRSNLRDVIGEYREEEIERVRQLYGDFRKDVEQILTEEQLKELDRIANPDSVSRRWRQRGGPPD